VGKQKTLALGVYPEVSLKEASEKQADARKLIRNGQDPAEIKREQKPQQMAQSENSFKNIAREWHGKQGRWTANRSPRVLSSREKEFFSHIGDKPIEDITAPMILEAVRRVERRNVLGVTSRLLQRVSSIYRYTTHTGRVSHNPAANLADSLKTRKVAHRAALSHAELPEFQSRLQAYDGQPVTRLALQLIVPTFVCSRELRGARWDEFDLERAEWRIF
jgi:integrase